MKTNTDGGHRDEAWFEALFRQHHTKILAYSRRRMPEAADDIVSEVFETAWKSRDRLPEDVLPWLYRTAANHLLHHHRSTVRHDGRVERAQSLVSSEQFDPADLLVENLDRVAQVSNLLNQLNATDAEVLRLWAWEQLETHEIAVVLDCSPATARVRLHRARKRCAALLDDTASETRVVPQLVEETS